ncbi:helix-turn-helix domain-containing protein [Acinetobacter indicus]|uniref:AraC family transcriptional regulator n=1 Tax=Acinetobacter indicus TaxID=756892 RepID=A0A6C0Y701_9GAMM|nr:AraC family transcriptional regulator [Acinetobacter indicus]
MRYLAYHVSLFATVPSIVNAALNAGFFDQSHMTRHFIKTFGLTPTQWKMINIKR